MFSGIVEGIGLVTGVKRDASGNFISVKSDLFDESIAAGDSIAVDGVCLTVLSAVNHEARFEISSETERRTTLKDLSEGVRVNLERALQFGQRVNGHLVTGHVDAVAKILQRTEKGVDLELLIEIPPLLEGLIVEKGSVTVAGVSLTVGMTVQNKFALHIVQYTRNCTTLGSLGEGDPVNLEADIIARYINGIISKRGVPG